ncbi:MAG: hypothetical protein ABIH08_04245 [Candidatus Omnitrophota bacterium]
MAGEARTKTPIGILVLGGLNCFFLGFIFFVSSLINYFKITPEEFDKILQTFRSLGVQASPGQAEITYQQFKPYSFIPIIIALVFFISGSGILFRKEWARKLTVYFSFTAAIFIFFTVLAQASLIRLVIAHIVYLGVLIIYFTNKNVEGYFTATRLSSRR